VVGQKACLEHKNIADRPDTNLDIECATEKEYSSERSLICRRVKLVAFKFLAWLSCS
jgi:hypothetical protein